MNNDIMLMRTKENEEPSSKVHSLPWLRKQSCYTNGYYHQSLWKDRRILNKKFNWLYPDKSYCQLFYFIRFDSTLLYVGRQEGMEWVNKFWFITLIAIAVGTSSAKARWWKSFKIGRILLQWLMETKVVPFWAVRVHPDTEIVTQRYYYLC